MQSFSAEIIFFYFLLNRKNPQNKTTKKQIAFQDAQFDGLSFIYTLTFSRFVYLFLHLPNAGSPAPNVHSIHGAEGKLSCLPLIRTTKLKKSRLPWDWFDIFFMILFYHFFPSLAVLCWEDHIFLQEMTKKNCAFIRCKTCVFCYFNFVVLMFCMQIKWFEVW